MIDAGKRCATRAVGCVKMWTMRSVLVFVLLVSVLNAGCDEEPPEAAAVKTETRTITATVTDTVTETVAQEPSGVCLDPGEVRKGLMSDILPNFRLFLLDATTVASDEVCCGPGYLIEVDDEFGEPNVFSAGNGRGGYSAGPIEDNDVTFTQEQWIKFSNYAARECWFRVSTDV